MDDPVTLLDPPVEGALDWLLEMSGHFDVVLLTTRGQYEGCEKAIRYWMLHWYLEQHGRNIDCSEYVLGQFTRMRITHEKVPALIYLDDRAVRFEGPGTFPDRQAIHDALPWHRRSPAKYCEAIVDRRYADGWAKEFCSARARGQRDGYAVCGIHAKAKAPDLSRHRRPR